jgi:hypothetical protein
VLTEASEAPPARRDDLRAAELAWALRIMLKKRSGAIEKLRAGLWRAAVQRFQLKWVQFSFDFLSSFLSGGTQM